MSDSRSRAVMALGAPTEDEPPEGQTRIRCAMLSVYHHSLGRQFQLRGAPAVLLPPEVRPLDLAQALAILADRPALFRNALWRLIRSVPVARGKLPVPRRYPRELVELVGEDKLTDLDDRRREYRRDAHLFTAALAACADGSWEQFRQLQSMLADRRKPDRRDICSATNITLGRTAPDFLDVLHEGDQERVERQVARLEDEVGLDLGDLVDDFADTAAFMDYVNETRESGRDGVGVYPVSSVIYQDARTLVTTATITTVVTADFDTLCVAVDPRRWPSGNDVVTKTTLVADPFARSALRSDESPPEGAGWCDRARFVEETAQIFWGGDPAQQACFQNVLYVHPFAVQADAGRIDLSFSLSRSVRSRVLWDERPGGVVLDSGYIKARRLVDNRWRVTRRKVVRFSDRTPYTNGRGWLDAGQMLNYLAPAALSYWLENDIASLEIPANG